MKFSVACLVVMNAAALARALPTHVQNKQRSVKALFVKVRDIPSIISSEEDQEFPSFSPTGYQGVAPSYGTGTGTATGCFPWPTATGTGVYPTEYPHPTGGNCPPNPTEVFPTGTGAPEYPYPTGTGYAPPPTMTDAPTTGDVEDETGDGQAEEPCGGDGARCVIKGPNGAVTTSTQAREFTSVQTAAA